MKLAASTDHPAFVGAPDSRALPVCCAFSFKKAESRNFVLFIRKCFGIRQGPGGIVQLHITRPNPKLIPFLIILFLRNANAPSLTNNVIFVSR
jgi:hypothetical protein